MALAGHSIENSRAGVPASASHALVSRLQPASIAFRQLTDKLCRYTLPLSIKWSSLSPHSRTAKSPMLYVDCCCTKRLSVKPSHCGESIECACGRSVAVPKLSELRRLCGVGELNLSAIERLRSMDRQGLILTDATCSGCRMRRGQLLDCLIQCESRVTEEPSRLALFDCILGIVGALPFFSLFTIARSFNSQYSNNDDLKVHGRDTSIIVSVPVCTECESGFCKSNQKRITALRTIRAYDELLKAYPDATTQYWERETPRASAELVRNVPFHE